MKTKEINNNKNTLIAGENIFPPTGEKKIFDVWYYIETWIWFGIVMPEKTLGQNAVTFVSNKRCPADGNETLLRNKRSYDTYLSLMLSLSGSFEANGNQANGDKWKAKITYKVIAEVDRPGSGEVLKVRCRQKKKFANLFTVSSVLFKSLFHHWVFVTVTCTVYCIRDFTVNQKRKDL